MLEITPHDIFGLPNSPLNVSWSIDLVPTFVIWYLDLNKSLFTYFVARPLQVILLVNMLYVCLNTYKKQLNSINEELPNIFSLVQYLLIFHYRHDCGLVIVITMTKQFGGMSLYRSNKLLNYSASLLLEPMLLSQKPYKSMLHIFAYFIPRRWLTDLMKWQP